MKTECQYCQSQYSIEELDEHQVCFDRTFFLDIISDFSRKFVSPIQKTFLIYMRTTEVHCLSAQFHILVNPNQTIFISYFLNSPSAIDIREQTRHSTRSNPEPREWLHIWK